MNAYPPPYQQPEPQGPTHPYGVSSPDSSPGNPYYGYPPQQQFYGPPGPQPKRKTALIVGIVSAIVVMLVAGAATFLLLGDDDERSDEKSADSRAGNSASAAEPTEPDGAPYSFQPPEGFQDVTARAPKVGEFQSAFAPKGLAGSSAISVSVLDLGTTDLDRIKQTVSQDIQSSGGRLVSSDSIEVDGKQGLRLESETSSYDGLYHYVPTTENRLVYIYCELAGSGAEKTKAGCEQVLDSMKID